MIYICIDHINGEIDEVIDNIFTKEEAIELNKKWGFIIIEIDLIHKKVREI